MQENDGSKVARFVSGLRREIQDVVELYKSTTLEKLVHLAIKVESQLSKKNSFKTTVMMAFTNHLGRIKMNFQTRLLLPTREPTPQHRISKDTHSTSIPKSSTKTSHKMF